ncbi:MAG: hypothetical protein KF786_14255 [Burkholderiaceae bacterium]|nr:hypothetical protein [Burkholderiaceae bacterium]
MHVGCGRSCDAADRYQPASMTGSSRWRSRPRPQARRRCKATGLLRVAGPAERQASRYYSRPQLRTTGEFRVDGARVGVEGVAWLSTTSGPARSSMPSPTDGTGRPEPRFIGSALAAFRIRRS